MSSARSGVVRFISAARAVRQRATLLLPLEASKKRILAMVDAAKCGAGSAAKPAALDVMPKAPWWSWISTSRELLLYYQARILSHLRHPFTLRQVEFDYQDQPHHINTLSMPPYHPQDGPSSDRAVNADGMTVERAQSVGLPHLLLIHGFAGGLALWNLSLEALSQRYQVHAIDAPGFADSSRIKFSKDPDAAEDEICETIEAWRAAQGIEQMVVAGHSFGGFIAGNYALRHPERVQRLVLLDPWGLPQKPDDHNFSKYPWWARLSISVLSKFPPLAVVRAAGPWGESLMGLRKDLGLRFREYLGNDRDFYGYIYHCNAQSPSGELAFHHMSIPIGWAKNPLAPRLPLIDERIPINFMFGEQSWISPEPAVAFSATRPNSTVKFVPRAGHHLMWDNAPVFTETMLTLADEEARRHRVSVDSV